MIGDGRERRNTAENIGRRWKTAGDGGDGGGSQWTSRDDGRRLGTTQCGLPLSLALTCWANSENDTMDGLPCCAHRSALSNYTNLTRKELHLLLSS